MTDLTPPAESTEACPTYWDTRKRILETSVDAQYAYLPELNMVELRAYYTLLSRILSRYVEDVEARIIANKGPDAKRPKGGSRDPHMSSMWFTQAVIQLNQSKDALARGMFAMYGEAGGCPGADERDKLMEAAVDAVHENVKTTIMKMAICGKQEPRDDDTQDTDKE